ncbi:MAG TPA: 23S rRNA (adenine(2030)-N(6))-methyltransferase RlmJ [Beijerinckiaceae bacterium]|nr:23S rRNA (adenine(2030)-N(6))-methyltransferase RlmJ [Beijerinckiaceae bacterium]
MNYRHAFHAGNFADVLKHALLCRILVHLAAKDTPFRVIDTHAGTGVYDLTSSAAQRSPEWRDGIARLVGTHLPEEVAPLLAPYLALAAPMLSAERPTYPGSPRIALALTRTQDRLSFVEKHPDDIIGLKAAIAGDRRAKALHLDGWTAWNAQVPPPERRGLVLVDPPFEADSDWQRMVDGLIQSARKWAGGIVMLWYPVKDPATVERFFDALEATGIRKILRLELAVDQVRPDGPLAATGVIMVNPPHRLETEARLLLPFLARRLARSRDAATCIEWIVAE